MNHLLLASATIAEESTPKWLLGSAGNGLNKPFTKLAMSHPIKSGKEIPFLLMVGIAMKIFIKSVFFCGFPAFQKRDAKVPPFLTKFKKPKFYSLISPKRVTISSFCQRRQIRRAETTVFF
jgi:hypothetical protein